MSLQLLAAPSTWFSVSQQIPPAHGLLSQHSPEAPFTSLAVLSTDLPTQVSNHLRVSASIHKPISPGVQPALLLPLPQAEVSNCPNYSPSSSLHCSSRIQSKPYSIKLSYKPVPPSLPQPPKGDSSHRLCAPGEQSWCLTRLCPVGPSRVPRTGQVLSKGESTS